MGFSPANNPIVPFVNYTPYVCNISNIANGSTTMVTTTKNHGFVPGNVVYFSIPQEWGENQLNGLKGIVLSITDNTFIVNIDSTNFDLFISASAPTDVIYNNPQAIPAGDINSGTLSSGGVPVFPNTTPGAYTINGETL